jgi:predicted SprT family Zn-dependent metalloprotease
MKTKEALKQLNDLHTYCFLTQPEFRRMGFEFTERFFTEVGEALEKQIPFKPKEYEDKHYSCKCGNILLMKWKKYNTELTPKSEGLPYCLNCGQALDWSDT